MSARFERPSPGAPATVRFPLITRATLDTGLGVWHVRHDPVPIATATLAGVIITLMFFYLTGLTIIFGAEVNAALNQLGHAERG